MPLRSDAFWMTVTHVEPQQVVVCCTAHSSGAIFGFVSLICNMTPKTKNLPLCGRSVRLSEGGSVTRLRLDVPGFESRFFPPKTPRLALEPTQPNVLWYRSFFSRGESRRDLRLTIHVYLVLRLRMSGAIPSFGLYAYVAYIETNWRLPLLEFTGPQEPF
jgi:hypothetical protein